jgi:hypothetical protein
MSGEVNAVGDRDWFRFDLRAGDVFGAALKGQNGLNPALRMLDSAGTLLLANDDARGIGRSSLPQESPLPYTTRSATDAEVYYVISAPGTYLIEVSASGDAGTGKYDLDTMVARPGLEAQPVGTRQILFLDFDGGTARFDGNKWTMASLADSLPLIGLPPAGESAFIDAVVAGVTDRLQTFVRANGLNGDYSATGVPGQFDIEIRNSRDHADEFGTNPFVSRITLGWTDNALLANSYIGIAEATDVGNFKTDDQAVVSLNFATFALGGYAVQPPATRLDMIAMYAAWIAAHEFGHLAGCYHTDISPAEPFAGTPTVMDKSFDLGVGPDLTFGTADDVTVRLRADLYHRGEGFTGLHDTLNTVAFGLSTGTGSAPGAAAVAGATAGRLHGSFLVEPQPAWAVARWPVTGVDAVGRGAADARHANQASTILGLAPGRPFWLGTSAGPGGTTATRDDGDGGEVAEGDVLGMRCTFGGVYVGDPEVLLPLVPAPDDTFPRAWTGSQKK